MTIPAGVVVVVIAVVVGCSCGAVVFLFSRPNKTAKTIVEARRIPTKTASNGTKLRRERFGKGNWSLEIKDLCLDEMKMAHTLFVRAARVASQCPLKLI
jgi:hypothetical protein